MSSKKSRYFIAVLMAFLLWFSGNFRFIGYSEQIQDMGFPKELAVQINDLKRKDKIFFFSQTPSSNLSPLIYLFLTDRFFSLQEREMIDLVQQNYGREYFSEKQAKFFLYLTTLPNYKDFFFYKLPFTEIESIPLKSDLLNFVDIEVFQKNESNIPIIMYHTTDGASVGISKTTFINHLQLLNKAGYSTMKLNDYYQGNFSKVPNGRKPIILTFDDGWNSQFSYLDKEGKIIDPNCTVGILEEFARKNPLFGKNAVFFPYLRILPFTLSIGDYKQSNLWKDKMHYLQTNDFEIGCHTYNHAYLNKVSDSVVKKELDTFFIKMKTAIKNLITDIMFFAYPGGHYPKNMKLIEDYSFEKNKLKLSLTAFGGNAKVPFHSNPDIHKITRILGEDIQINNVAMQKSFVKTGYKITLPKLFLSSDTLLKNWIEKNTHYKTQYLVTDPTILFSIYKP
jgi:peptidoglycan/xylan/chitin deacetylase (PgdA/CDA1 family)